MGCKISKHFYYVDYPHHRYKSEIKAIREQASLKNKDQVIVKKDHNNEEFEALI